MRTPLPSKKFLLLALLEDVLLIFFLLTFLAASLEILLPGILANRMPLAFLFTTLAGLFWLYSFWLKKEALPYPPLRLPVPILLLLFAGLIIVTLFMNRAFGIWGALVQFGLLAAALFYSWFGKE